MWKQLSYLQSLPRLSLIASSLSLSLSLGLSLSLSRPLSLSLGLSLSLSLCTGGHSAHMTVKVKDEDGIARVLLCSVND